jgi:hypothetical protein
MISLLFVLRAASEAISARVVDGYKSKFPNFLQSTLPTSNFSKFDLVVWETKHAMAAT